jgi:hypothetical protein
MTLKALPASIKLKRKDPIYHPCPICLVKMMCKNKDFLSCDLLGDYVNLFLCIKKILRNDGVEVDYYTKKVMLSYGVDAGDYGNITLNVPATYMHKHGVNFNPAKSDWSPI